MKKIIALVFALIFLFSFSGCGNTENKGNDISQIPTDTSFVGRIKEIKDITNNMNGMCFPDGFDIEEPFFEDESYIYIFGSPISQHVIVEYTDGSTENIKEALENGHIQITDLDKYSIHYTKIKAETNVLTLTIAETLPSCAAFEYREPNKPYCLYAYDTDGHLYRVLWTDWDGLKEKDQIFVEYSDIKELDQTNPPGGWTPQYEVVASSVKLERNK